MAERTLCLKCLRPSTACFCARLPSIATKTRVVFLQHPRERRMAIGTARLAHLSLPNSELHVGVHFDQNARVRQVARPEEAVVLFPAEGAVEPAQLTRTPKTLVVIDGTWPQARKVFKENPLLQALPKIAFRPRRPSNYRIRKEPADHCVSTIEAVAEVLGQLEGDVDRFLPMLQPFEAMVDHQLESKERRTTPPRRRQNPLKGLRSAYWARIRERLDDAVLVYAEANAYPLGSTPHFEPEVIHWVAVRPSTGARFEALVRPRHPLAPSTAFHLGIDEATLLCGEELPAALARWRAFSHPSADVLFSWGPYTLQLLAQERLPVEPGFDLRLLLKQRLKKRPGAVEDAAPALCDAARPPWTRGRAGRRIAALEDVFAVFRKTLAPAVRVAHVEPAPPT